jgi:hypothetical protein
VEHLDGLGLVTPADVEKLIDLHAPLLLVCGIAGAIETLGTGLRRDERSEIDQLPGLQGDQLIAGLAGLKDADRRLARRPDDTSPFVWMRDVSSDCTTPA